MIVRSHKNVYARPAERLSGASLLLRVRAILYIPAHMRHARCKTAGRKFRINAKFRVYIHEITTAKNVIISDDFAAFSRLVNFSEKNR